MSHHRVGLLPSVVLFLGLATIASAQPIAPVGSEVQVNEVTSLNQVQAHVAAASDGRFVIVWQDLQSGYSILFRRFSSTGSPVGGEANASATGSSQKHARVDVSASGTFVVAWDQQSSSADSLYGIRASRLSSSGTILATDFQVNTGTTSFQRYPDIALQSNGDFVVVWESSVSASTDTDDLSIQMQRYASNGAPLGIETQVNTWTTGAQASAAIAVANNDSFLVVWASPAAGDSGQILGQLFSNDGIASGSELVINSVTAGNQSSPAISHDEGTDRFVVVWRTTEIGGRILDSTGTGLTDDLAINSLTTGFQGYPDVTTGTDGSFQAIWYSFGSTGTDSDSSSIQTRRFDSAGIPLGDDLQINTSTSGFQAFPAIVRASSSEVVAVWESDDSAGDDTSNRSIQCQRLGDDLDEDGDPDVSDTDDDNDGVGDESDNDPSDPFSCQDLDKDLCDDCSNGVDGLGALPDFDPFDDGSDFDDDGACDLGDSDDDDDGVDDNDDSDPFDAFLCRDVDEDQCDDCYSGSDDPLSDGTDTDSDGACNIGDSDDDDDGCLDAEDAHPLILSGDSDKDGTADDCDLCPGFDDTVDTDGDGSADGCDLCTGDDATGDVDMNGVCDGLFDDGFENGTTSEWS